MNPRVPWSFVKLQARGTESVLFLSRQLYANWHLFTTIHWSVAFDFMVSFVWAAGFTVGQWCGYGDVDRWLVALFIVTSSCVIVYLRHNRLAAEFWTDRVLQPWWNRSLSRSHKVQFERNSRFVLSPTLSMRNLRLLHPAPTPTPLLASPSFSLAPLPFAFSPSPNLYCASMVGLGPFLNGAFHADLALSCVKPTMHEILLASGSHWKITLRKDSDQ